MDNISIIDVEQEAIKQDISAILEKNQKILKNDIVKLIQKNFINSRVFSPFDCSKLRCRKIFDVVVATISDIIAKYGEHEITNTLRFGDMGAFSIKKMSARIVKIHGKEYLVGEKKRIHFKYSTKSRKKLNSSSSTLP